MILSGVVLLPDGARLAIALSRVECSGLSDGKRYGHSASAARNVTESVQALPLAGQE